MTNTPGSGWPGDPPPQGPGSPPPNWGSQQYPGPSGQPYPGQPGQHPGQSGQQNPGQHNPGQAQQPGQPSAPGPANQPGFDPTRALGEAPPTSVSIDQFKPPTNRTPLLITIVALITLAAVVIGGMYFRSQPLAPSPSPSTPTPGRSVPAGSGQEFETPNGQQKGTWEIIDHQWTDEGLQVELKVTSTSGPITFSFMAFTNGTTEVVDPTSSPKQPDIRTGTTSPSRPVSGYVFFPMNRGDATIILATGSGRQMSALPVRG